MHHVTDGAPDFNKVTTGLFFLVSSTVLSQTCRAPPSCLAREKGKKKKKERIDNNG